MKKRGIRALAVLLAGALTFALTGCADTLWVMKTKTVSVPTGVYLYYLLDAKEQLSEGTAGKTDATSSGTVSDPWGQKVAGKSAKDWAVSEAQKETRELLATETLCKQRKVSLTSSEKSTVSSYAKNMMSSYTIFSNNGISETSLERVLAYSYYLKDALFQSYYGSTGTEAVSDAALKAYYTAHFVQIKQIFFSITDDSGNALSSTEQKAKKKKAQDVLGQISADRSNFDALVKTDNEDSGMTSDPTGYVFGKTSSYLSVFKNAAFKMKVGDVKLIKSSEGYHIMYKVALDSSKFDSAKSDVLTDMKQATFTKMLDSYKGITVNGATIFRYNPKSLADETSEASTATTTTTASDSTTTTASESSSTASTSS